MLTTTHVLVGAGAGEVVHEPFLAFFLSILLHFVTDKIPHYWPKNQTQKNVLVIIDWTAAILIIVTLILLPVINKPSVVAGAVAGLLVDALLVGVPYFHKTKLGLWHTNRQPHRTSTFFLFTDMIFILPLATFIILKGF